MTDKMQIFQTILVRPKWPKFAQFCLLAIESFVFISVLVHWIFLVFIMTFNLGRSNRHSPNLKKKTALPNKLVKEKKEPAIWVFFISCQNVEKSCYSKDFQRTQGCETEGFFNMVKLRGLSIFNRKSCVDV